MKQKPADWQPLLGVYTLERERKQREALEGYRLAARGARVLERMDRATGSRQSARDASLVIEAV